MLLSLNIKNVAVIKQLEVNFKEGVTVFTGETGAGKSIIIDSINMILGGRSSRELVRYGTDKAVVQAVFEGSDEICASLYEEDIETEDNQIIITRSVTKDGKSTAKINGTVVTLSVLREIADKLINIHGQHDNQALLTPEKHIDFLDDYAHDETAKSGYLVLYTEMRKIKRELAALSVNEKEKMQRIDLLEYQIKEINSANLIKGEDSDLTEQRMLLENAEQIALSAEAAYSNLYDMSEGNSAYDALSVAAESLKEICGINPEINSIYERINEAMYSVEDAAHEIKELSDGIDYDPQVLNDVEERLDLISKLKRKYGQSITEILKYRDKAQEELNSIVSSEEKTEELQKKLDEIRAELKKSASELSELRKEAAKSLGMGIEKALKELDMEKAKFRVCISSKGVFESDGTDRVEFMISTNPGEPLKPLVKIASGGELSRVMLAMKSVLAETDKVDTLIFDEIDTGVSGSAALKIAQKLRQIGTNKQVICITHLPQMTAAADNHYLISKDMDGEMASTSIKELDEKGRIDEIARIIDGGQITDIARKHAKELLRSRK